jgi:hypothetical protein
VLRPLIEDRELTLFDGTRLMRYDRYQKLRETHSEEQLKELRIMPVLPSFRVIALALPPPVKGSGGESKGLSWLVEETMTLFSYHIMPDMPVAIKMRILQYMFPSLAEKGLAALLRFSDRLTTGDGVATGSSSSVAASASLALSLRQLIRLSRRYTTYPNDLADSLRERVESQIHQFATAIGSGSSATTTTGSSSVPLGVPRVVNGRLHIGDVSYPVVAQPKHPELVPQILFYDIPKHVAILQDMLKDLCVGERHILLIGNQGVGKNKLSDRLLQLLNMEREYIQLHRDTTVQTLTISPTLRDGVIHYEDSPLVKAVENGRVLVIDEADKAPLEVVSILKGLVEDGEMSLSDGRRIVSVAPTGTHQLPSSVINSAVAASAGKIIVMHPNFRVIVLANRPGFPFLGNLI